MSSVSAISSTFIKKTIPTATKHSLLFPFRYGPGLYCGAVSLKKMAPISGLLLACNPSEPREFLGRNPPKFSTETPPMYRPTPFEVPEISTDPEIDPGSTPAEVNTVPDPPPVGPSPDFPVPPAPSPPVPDLPRPPAPSPPNPDIPFPKPPDIEPPNPKIPRPDQLPPKPPGPEILTLPSPPFPGILPTTAWSELNRPFAF